MSLYSDETFRIGYLRDVCPVCKHGRGYHYEHAGLILCARRLSEKYTYYPNGGWCFCNYYIDCIEEEADEFTHRCPSTKE